MILQFLAALAGYVVAEIFLRWMATRKPADMPTMRASRPWYGRDAAAASTRRLPLIWLVSLLLVGVAYIRSPESSPGQWFVGGVGLCAAVRLVFWWILPIVLRVEWFGVESFVNRVLPLEQSDVQNEVDRILGTWDTVPSLLHSQHGLIASPIAHRPLTEEERQRGQEYLAATSEFCQYTVQEGDYLEELCRGVAVSPELTERFVARCHELNPGLAWEPGSRWKLPRPICLYLIEKGQERARQEPH